jgi:hypothetical protein
MLLGQQPVLVELLSVVGSPLEHEGAGATRQLAGKHAQRLDIDLGALLAVVRMKVRR